MNHTIVVEPANHIVYRVTINDEDGTSTRHEVTVPDAYAASLGREPNEASEIIELIHQSFEFLLAREPKEAILPSFELSVIEHHFPEYPSVIGR